MPQSMTIDNAELNSLLCHYFVNSRLESTFGQPESVGFVAQMMFKRLDAERHLRRKRRLGLD